MTKKSFTGMVTAAVTAVIFSSCHSGDIAPDHKSGGPAAQSPQSYSVLTLEPKKISAHLDFPATIQGVQVIEIRPMISGYIATINVQEGAAVKKGQLLFTIKNPQYEQDVRSEQAAIKSAEANVSTAEMNVKKVRPLVDEDIVSKYELESAEYTLKADQAALAQAKAALENALTNQGYTVIHSPLDGVIGTIPYKVGALVSSTSTDPLTNLSDIGEVYAYFSLDEKQLLQLLDNGADGSIEAKLNQLSGVSLVLANGALYPLKGKLETASGLVTTNTGSTSFKARFANPRGIIRSGASAILRIPHNYDSAIIVPQSATAEIQDKKLVYVVGKGNKIHPATVTASPTDDGKYYIVTKGLAPGDQIVLNGISALRDSLQVVPVNVNADSVYGLLRAEQ